jgi:protein-tyrosine phosphatase
MSETAKKFGVSIEDLTARQFVVSDFDQFDLIYAMDASNYTNIISLSRNDKDVSKVKLILNESHPGQDLSVPDPYYGGDQGFIDVFKLLDEATDVIMKNITN